MLFRKIFEKNLKAGEIVFQNEEDLNIQERPFPNHHNNKKGKWQVKMVSSAEKDIEEHVPMQPEDEPDYSKTVQWLQNVFKF